MVLAGAVDCLQIDVTRCGGYTTWLRAAAVAGAQGLEVSAHSAPNLHAHVGLSVPHIRHIEYFHDHHRIETILFDGALDPQGGTLGRTSISRVTAWPSRSRRPRPIGADGATPLRPSIGLPAPYSGKATKQTTGGCHGRNRRISCRARSTVRPHWWPRRSWPRTRECAPSSSRTTSTRGSTVRARARSCGVSSAPSVPRRHTRSRRASRARPSGSTRRSWPRPPQRRSSCSRGGSSSGSVRARP